MNGDNRRTIQRPFSKLAPSLFLPHHLGAGIVLLEEPPFNEPPFRVGPAD